MVLPLAVAYCVIIAMQMLSAPDPVKTEILWAVSAGPFRMPVRCEVVSGCLLSNAVGDRNPGCIQLGHKEETDVVIEFSDFFLDGPSILGNVESPVKTGKGPCDIHCVFSLCSVLMLVLSGQEPRQLPRFSAKSGWRVIPTQMKTQLS